MSGINKLPSQKAYLIRAIYEWCSDNDFTPHLAANVDKNTMVPMQYVQNSQIVLNIAFSATKDLLIDNQWVTFKASFGGSAHDVAVPVANVLAIFAKENGQGMQFEQEETAPEPTKKSSGLKLVK